MIRQASQFLQDLQSAEQQMLLGVFADSDKAFESGLHKLMKTVFGFDIDVPTADLVRLQESYKNDRDQGYHDALVYGINHTRQAK